MQSIAGWHSKEHGVEKLKILFKILFKKPVFTLPEAFLFRNKNQIISLRSQELVPAVNNPEEAFL